MNTLANPTTDSLLREVSTGTHEERVSAARELAFRARHLRSDPSFELVKETLKKLIVGDNEELAVQAADTFVGIGDSVIPELVELIVSHGDPHQAVDDAIGIVLFRDRKQYQSLRREMRRLLYLKSLGDSPAQDE